VSETQTAECRSSKPNVAGSIPVAHSTNRGFGIADLGFERNNFSFSNPKSAIPNPKFKQARSLTGKAPVSKTGVLRSNRGAPANFRQRAKNTVFASHSHRFAEGKPNRCGSSPENCREQSHTGSNPVPSFNDLGLRIWDLGFAFNLKSAIPNQNGFVAQWNQSAGLRNLRLCVRVAPEPS
jgi:hypothetical protein